MKKLNRSIKVICLSIAGLLLVQTGPLMAHTGDHFLYLSFDGLFHYFSHGEYWLMMAAVLMGLMMLVIATSIKSRFLAQPVLHKKSRPSVSGDIFFKASDS